MPEAPTNKIVYVCLEYLIYWKQRAQRCLWEITGLGSWPQPGLDGQLVHLTMCMVLKCTYSIIQELR